MTATERTYRGMSRVAEPGEGLGLDEPLSLGLEDLMRRSAVTSRVLLECAGNGRARFEPRPVS
jgi:hypothetical protein